MKHEQRHRNERLPEGRFFSQHYGCDNVLSLILSCVWIKSQYYVFIINLFVVRQYLLSMMFLWHFRMVWEQCDSRSTKLKYNKSCGDSEPLAKSLKISSLKCDISYPLWLGGRGDEDLYFHLSIISICRMTGTWLALVKLCWLVFILSSNLWICEGVGFRGKKKNSC